MKNFGNVVVFAGLVGVAAWLSPSLANAAPSDSQKCEAAIERASGAFTRCRLGREAAFTVTGREITNGLDRCATAFAKRYDRAFVRFGASCPSIVPMDPLRSALIQCATNVVNAAGEAGTSGLDSQRCEAAVERASGAYAGCVMRQEANGTQTGRYSAAGLAKCARALAGRYDRAVAKYGAACPFTLPVSGFQALIDQCTPYASPETGAPKPVISMNPTAVEGTLIHGSMIAGAGAVSYQWTQIAGPAVTLTGADTASVSFTAPSPGNAPQTLTFKGEVTDGSGAVTSATQSIVIQPDGIWVDAGKSRIVGEGQTIHLNAQGAGSGPQANYAWTQTSPASPQPPLTGASTDNPSFVTPTVTDATTLVFEVTFNDGLKTATDSVSVTVQPPQTVSPNAPLTLPGATQQQPLVVVVQPAAEVPAGSTQKLSVVASGGDGHYSFDWKKPVSSSANPACDTTEGPDNGQIYEVTLPGACPDLNVTYKIGVIVTDGQGQSAEQDTDLWVNVPSGLPLNVYAPTAAVNEGPLPVTIGASAQGGTAPYTYSWAQTGGPSVTLTGAGTAQPSFKAPAVDADTTLTFQVTVTDSAAGMASRDMNVLVRNAFALTPPQVLLLQLPPESEVLAGVAQKLAASASGGTPPYTWLWEQTGGSPATLDGATTDAVTVTPGMGPDTVTLEVTVTDSAMVSTYATVQVNVPGAPSAQPLSVQVSPQQYVDEGTAAVPVTVVAQGGTGTYTYSWLFIASGGLDTLALTDGNTNVVRFDAPQVSAQATLRFRVTVASGAAVVTKDAYVTVKDVTPPLELKLVGDELTGHSGQTMTLGVGPARGGTLPYTYGWAQTAGTPSVTLTDNGDGTATFTAPAVASGSKAPLSFELTVTDAAGNVQHATQRVVIDQGMTITALSCPTGTITAGSDLTATVQMAGGSVPTFATAPLHYRWTTETPSLSGLPDATTFTQAVPPGTAAGTMTVRVEVRDSSSPAQVRTQSCTVTIGAAPVATTSSKEGAWCLICGNEATKTPCNDLDLVLGQATKCPDDKPYCMNDVIQRGADIREYRRCVVEGGVVSTNVPADDPSRQTCYYLWYNSTSDEPLCLPFDHNSEEDSLNCHLCCWVDPSSSGPDNACNLDTNPPDNLLYRP